MNGGPLFNDDEAEKVLVKETIQTLNVPFSSSVLKDFVARHVVRKQTQVSQDALDLLNRVFDEVGGWIVRESENMAQSSGRTRITADHIRGAVKLYLGWEEEK
jgi:histone H3/H4